MTPCAIVTGASGLIGKEVVTSLQSKGWEVRTISRNPKPGDPKAISWNVANGELETAKLSGARIVVHLAGEPIAAKRWNPQVKAELRASRVDGTRLLVSKLRELGEGLDVFLSASAIGFYGNRGAEILDESSSIGGGFLPDISREWEDEAAKSAAFSKRLACSRFGLVLSPKGGALKEMLPPFRLGVGGKLGSGEQFMSWISLPDTARGLEFLLEKSDLSGAFNFVAPTPVTNAEFTKTLASVLHRPAFFTMPSFGVKLLFGEMGETLLLGSTRVVPARLEQAGFHFESSELRGALESLLS